MATTMMTTEQLTAIGLPEEQAKKSVATLTVDDVTKMSGGLNKQVRNGVKPSRRRNQPFFFKEMVSSGSRRDDGINRFFVIHTNESSPRHMCRLSLDERVQGCPLPAATCSRSMKTSRRRK